MARRRADRDGRDVLGDGQLVPATGGDNFPAFNAGTQKRDTGKVDLRGDGRLHGRVRQPRRGRRSAAGRLPPACGRDRVPGRCAGDVRARRPGDVRRVVVVVHGRGGRQGRRGRGVARRRGAGSFPLDNAPPAALPGFDDQGKATVTVTLPADTPAGTAVLTLTGETTGTTTTVPVEVEAGEPAPTTVTADRGEHPVRHRRRGRGGRRLGAAARVARSRCATAPGCWALPRWPRTARRR